MGIAGRSREKLEQVKARYGGDWEILVADSQDDAALKAMAERTKVVATTVGPYSKYGFPLARACAQAGTHYADLTGETLFMRRTIDELDAVAKESGARIVHNCGFDSIPSDIGTLLLHEQLGELGETTLVVRRAKGGFSGGTIDSMRGSIDEAKRDPKARKLMFDPYALSPDRSQEPGDPGKELRGVEHSAELGGWLAPFIMAVINTRVVRRSSALMGWAYGPNFRYREVMSFGEGIKGRAMATGVAVGTAGIGFGMALPPTRFVLDRVLPDPGEGPKEELVRNGFFHIEVHTQTPNGERWKTDIRAPGDPGYGATAVMLGESALALAGDGLPDRAGVLTPASGIGTVLADRLRAAGHTYDVGRA